jgi:predicted N-formylglutamate amidohydrolase
MSPRRSSPDTLSQRRAIVLSCEHAGHVVPRAYRHLFARAPAVLTTHQGYDIGIVSVARRMAKILNAPLIACRTSRLLIEPNRSLHHPNLFSRFSRNLPGVDKRRLIANIWQPHRKAVREAILGHIHSHRQVLHLALHSFTPVLDGRVRNADVGLLYDPQRYQEKRIAIALQQALQQATGLHVRRNYPYRGNSDGLTTSLRRTLDPRDYLGLEVELNQSLLSGPAARPSNPAKAISEAIRSL